MSFWRTFGFTTISPVETILDREHFTLEELLDEEELLQECKSQNKKLLDFLVKPEELKKLVTYITTEPEENTDSKRKFKYPFLACEILCSEVWAICEAFYEHEGLLEKLYGFLDNDPPLNPLLASYVSRVAGVLLQKKVQKTIAFMQSRDNLVDKFIKHLGSSAVMDLLLKVIACEETPEGKGILEWLCTASLIPRLVGKFDPSLGSEVHENAAQALVDIITVSTTQLNPQNNYNIYSYNNTPPPPENNAPSTPSPLMIQLESEETVKQLLGYILDEGATSSLLHGLSVVIELLKRNVQETLNTTTTVPELPPLLRVILEYLDKFKGILDSPPDQQSVISTVGELQPLGFYRLKVIEFVVALVKTNYHCVSDALVNLSLLNTSFDLFFKFEWNNFLHYTIEQLIECILKGDNPDLKLALLTSCKLIDRIVTASNENDIQVEQPRGSRKGYMGYLTAVSVHLLNEANQNTTVADFLNAHEGWKTYVETKLNETRKIENSPLGGHKPSSFADSMNDDEDLAESTVQAVFSQYLAQQGFPTNFQDLDDDDDEEEEDEEDEDDEEEELEDDEGFDADRDFQPRTHDDLKNDRIQLIDDEGDQEGTPETRES